MSYRVALMVDGRQVAKPDRQIAEWAREHRSIDLVAMIVDAGGSRGSCTPMARMLLRPLAALERKLLLRGSDDAGYFVSSSVADLGPAFSANEVDKLRELNLDAIVQCGGSVRTGLSDLARDGVISMHYGGLAGFAEVVEGRPSTSFTVRQLKAGRTETLFRGSISTKLFYSENRVALYDRSVPYLLRTVERLAGGEEVKSPSADEPTPSKTVAAADVLNYVWRTFGRAARKQWRHAVGREWNWGVAYSFEPWQGADLRSGHVLPNLPGTFVADPFAVEAGGKRYIFVEEFPFSTRRGVISVFEVDEAGARRLGVAIEEPYHLSFPFVFRKDGRFYMVPEGQGGGAMVLYECTDFPLQWTRKKVLLPKVCADTLIFEHGSSWWMLTTVKGEGSAENSAELHAFYADDPLGDWRPHRMNPVIMDASKGRNGGLLKDDQGRIHRVAQRAGFRTYGDAFAIYRIDELSPDSYRETLVREVRPDFFPRLAGTHHMHSEDGLTVYDFSRDERP